MKKFITGFLSGVCFCAVILSIMITTRSIRLAPQHVPDEYAKAANELVDRFNSANKEFLSEVKVGETVRIYGTGSTDDYAAFDKAIREKMGRESSDSPPSQSSAQGAEGRVLFYYEWGSTH